MSILAVDDLASRSAASAPSTTVSFEVRQRR